MAEWILKILLGFMYVINISSTSENCPEKCSCIVTTAPTLLLNCSNKALNEFPSAVNLLDFQFEKLFNHYGTNLSLEINLSKNKITQARFPSTIKQVKRIDLSHNEISSLERVAVEKARSLEELDLSHNRMIEKISAELINEGLTILNISHCSVQELDADFLRQVPALTVLDLSYNAIPALVPFKRNSSTLQLTRLNLSHNHLNRINIKDLKLKVLDISSNFVGRAAISLLHLEELNASDNALETINSIIIPSALLLDLSRNKLRDTKFDFTKKAPRLKVLNLSQNPIETLWEIKSFSLTELDLSYCRIKSIQDRAFSHMDRLQRLNLAGNQLGILHHSILAERKNLLHLRLDHNPWNCECTSAQFRALYDVVVSHKLYPEEGDLICEDHRITWPKACRDVRDELRIAKRGAFYTMLSIIGTLMSIFCLLLCFRCVTSLRQNQVLIVDAGTNVNDEWERDYRNRVEAEDESNLRQLPVRKSTPPPNYDAALSMPVLSEHKRQMALSSLSINTTFNAKNSNE